MSSARSIDLGLTHATQRRHVFVLAIALCMWMLAYATHLHAGDDHDQAKPSCSFCLTLPTSAAPPSAVPQVHTAVFQDCGVACDQVTTVVARDLPSFYLSRGPPAH
jgi:hypothetical protein